MTPIRLGLVTSYMYPHLGGIERIAENLFNGYVASGLDVRWVASRVPSTLPSREGARIRVRCFNLVERVFGVPIPIWGVEGYRELDRLARWADALHVLECLYTSSALAVAAARRHGKPVIVSQNVGFVRYRLPPLNWLQSAAYRTLGRAVLRGSTHIVLATPAAESFIAALSSESLAHSSAFPIGIDTDRFRPATGEERAAARAALGLPAKAPVIMFAGRLVEKKGLPLVLAVSRQRPALQFLVVGDGPLAGLLQEPASNLSWRRTVRPDEMPRYYAAADAVLLPSRDEGLPLVVQEALASGCPTVISADEVYASALLESRVCIGAERSSTAMVEAIDRALGDDGRRLAVPARAYAERHWSLRTMMDRYVELIERFVGPRASTSGMRV